MSSKEPSNAIKRALKKHEDIVKLIQDIKVACTEANAFFDKFATRMKAPYKWLGLSKGPPQELKNANSDTLRECTEIGVGRSSMTFQNAVSEANTEFRAIFARPDDISAKELVNMLEKYKTIFTYLNLHKEQADCAKFKRLFTTIADELSDATEKIRDVHRKLERYDPEKKAALKEIISWVVAQAILEEREKVRSMPQPPSGAPGEASGASGGGRRRATRRQRAHRHRTRRARRS